MENDIFTLAHEIKNPLAISKGYLEMANKDNFQKYLGIIEQNINDALMILDSYLEYNRLVIEHDEMDFLYLLEEVIHSFRELYDININIICVYDELYINADFNKLKQVFINIFKNSYEAHAKKINLYIKIIDDMLNIQIADDGLGFNDLSNIGTGYTSKILGNGIGTKIILKIIQEHGGQLKYESNHPKGCLVIINIPLNYSKC